MIKRFFDIGISFSGIVLLSPVFLVLTVLNRMIHGSPILFKHKRPGRYGEPFVFYKFRTMTNERQVNGEFLPDEQRLTRFGRFLRSTSLDELPSLFNVLKGEMSIVGPRPLLMEYLPLYNSFQKRRHEVKPGITGWAQVKGRNSITWDEKFEKDIWYVDNQSFWLDVKILFLTILVTLKREGISANQHQTMPKFRGNIDKT